ncbi:hypothetical protein [Burkholderia phage BCSR5]|nr:hypothetical protein [Burkholderia phage BCSR5]
MKIEAAARLKAATELLADAMPDAIKHLVKYLESKGFDVDEVPQRGKVGKLEVNGRAMAIFAALNGSTMRNMGKGTGGRFLYSYNRGPKDIAFIEFDPKTCTIQFDR